MRERERGREKEKEKEKLIDLYYRKELIKMRIKNEKWWVITVNSPHLAGGKCIDRKIYICANNPIEALDKLKELKGYKPGFFLKDILNKSITIKDKKNYRKEKYKSPDIVLLESLENPEKELELIANIIISRNIPLDKALKEGVLGPLGVWDSERNIRLDRLSEI